jgi:hypothetical protein
MEYAGDYFRERVPGSIQVPLRIGPIRMGCRRAIATEIAVEVDRSDDARRHDAINLRLHPLGGFPFPELSAFLTARPHWPPGTWFVLDLSYEPPLGSLGRLVDVLAGRHVANAIGHALLDDVAAYLAGRFHVFSRAGEVRDRRI